MIITLLFTSSRIAKPRERVYLAVARVSKKIILFDNRNY